MFSILVAEPLLGKLKITVLMQRFPNFDQCLFSFLAQVCEQAYTMAQNLDPKSDGRGVLQFKTGLMSVIKVQ